MMKPTKDKREKIDRKGENRRGRQEEEGIKKESTRG
jgi:hypothetical protein